MFCKVLIPSLLVLSACQEPKTSSHNNTFYLPIDSAQKVHHESEIFRKDKVNSNHQVLTDTFYLPLDTAQIITLMNLKTKGEVAKLDHYEEDLDTIILRNGNFACDCQDWVTEEYDTIPDLGKYGYFIKPFDKKAELTNAFSVFHNRIRLIGTSSVENDMPLNTKLSDTIRVFTYYAYEVLLPAKVYGPLHHTGKTELPNGKEELIQRAVITIN